MNRRNITRSLARKSTLANPTIATPSRHTERARNTLGTNFGCKTLRRSPLKNHPSKQLTMKQRFPGSGHIGQQRTTVRRHHGEKKKRPCRTTWLTPRNSMNPRTRHAKRKAKKCNRKSRITVPRNPLNSNALVLGILPRKRRSTLTLPNKLAPCRTMRRVTLKTENGTQRPVPKTSPRDEITGPYMGTL